MLRRIGNFIKYICTMYYYQSMKKDEIKSSCNHIFFLFFQVYQGNEKNISLTRIRNLWIYILSRVTLFSFIYYVEFTNCKLQCNNRRKYKIRVLLFLLQFISSRICVTNEKVIDLILQKLQITK